ncbi:MAG: dihydroneopterin aldolase [Chloroflexota bacterium]
MDKVFIKDLRVRAIIGVHDWERERPQDVLINVTVYTDIRPSDAPDDLASCVDYSELAKEIRARMEGARRFTVEALAEDVAQVCLNRSRVQKVMVRVEKPGAVAGAESVGVEIERP